MVKSTTIARPAQPKLWLGFKPHGNTLGRRVFGRHDSRSVEIAIELGTQGWAVFTPLPQGGMSASFSKNKPQTVHSCFDTECALENMDDLTLARWALGYGKQRGPKTMRALRRAMDKAAKEGVEESEDKSSKMTTIGWIIRAIKWVMVPKKSVATD